jgi:mannose-6-phosphate isomerase-like protein (cupin superfamily)
MRSRLLAAALFVAVLPANAQTPVSAPLATTRAADGKAVVVSAEQITKLIATARAAYDASNPKNPNVRLPIIEGAPYTLNIEYRIGKAPSGIHPNHAELMVVLEGGATITTGGTLVSQRVLNEYTITAPDMTGGEPRKVARGDIIVVPEGMSHMLTPDAGGPFVIATALLPRTGGWAPQAPGAVGGRGGAPKLYAGAGELPGLVDGARKALPGSTRFFGGATLLSFAPYRIGLELRSPRGIASVHKNNAEFMWVLEGEGIIETGGTMVNPRETATSIDGDAQTGSTINRMKKGDFIFVPRGVPHLARSDGHFVLATMHVPGGAP